MGRVTRQADQRSTLESPNTSTKALQRTIQQLPGGPVVISDPVAATAYTFQRGDASSMVRLSSGSTITAMVPTDIDVAFGNGTQLYVIQWGAGGVNVVGAGGVSINSAVSLSLSTQYSGLWLVKIATNLWRAGPA